VRDKIGQRSVLFAQNVVLGQLIRQPRHVRQQMPQRDVIAAIARELRDKFPQRVV
jgi:hypothetical protein